MLCTSIGSHQIDTATTAPHPVKQITYKLREVYGNRRAYPVSDEAVFLARLTGTKTLRRSDLVNIVSLGFQPTTEQGVVITTNDID